jgi:hypothetical protein
MAQLTWLEKAEFCHTCADIGLRAANAAHFHALPRHPAILEGFEAASRAGMYPPEFHRSHFLENPKEFFAVTDTIYLFGRIQQPPFNCNVLAKNDPTYLAFLEKTFGRHECN